MYNKCYEYGYILWQVVAISCVSSTATTSTFSNELSSMKSTGTPTNCCEQLDDIGVCAGCGRQGRRLGTHGTVLTLLQRTSLPGTLQQKVTLNRFYELTVLFSHSY